MPMSELQISFHISLQILEPQTLSSDGANAKRKTSCVQLHRAASPRNSNQPPATTEGNFRTVHLAVIIQISEDHDFQTLV